MGFLITRRVKCDIPTTHRTPENTNIAGGRGHGQNPALGRRKFIDDLVDRTNSSNGSRHQESPVRRSSVTPGVTTLVSTVENTGEAATPSCIPTEEDGVSTAGSANQDLIYHINGKVVTKEEWTWFHKKFNDQLKHEEDKVEEDMSNRRDPEDHEEAMGENQHHQGNSSPEGTVATL